MIMTVRNLLEKCKITDALEITLKLKEEGQKSKRVMRCDIGYWKALNENILDCPVVEFSIWINLGRLEIIYKQENQFSKIHKVLKSDNTL